jgi:hypothetical protein
MVYMEYGIELADEDPVGDTVSVLGSAAYLDAAIPVRADVPRPVPASIAGALNPSMDPVDEGLRPRAAHWAPSLWPR